MSFSSDSKAEICRLKIEKPCCAVAESCGVLMFCNTFSLNEIRIITASREFSMRLPKLFKKAFNIEFDVLPDFESAGKKSFIIKNPGKLSSILSTLSLDSPAGFSLHVNFALLEEDCCKASFIRGAYLAGGSITDPGKSYHLELASSHKSAARETCSILQELNLYPGESQRTGNTLLYFKQSDSIADFLTVIGAPVSAMSVMTAKVDKEMRNAITRQINCDSANADKTVLASQSQLNAIKKYSARHGLDSLPEPLKDAALLRITNPEASLSDLSKLSIPPVSKSCLSHRLNKIISLVSEEE